MLDYLCSAGGVLAAMQDEMQTKRATRAHAYKSAQVRADEETHEEGTRAYTRYAFY